MSLAAAVSGHLPYLRRFARALTGNQESGDQYVAAVLETAVGDPDVLRGLEGDELKIALYRVLLSIWGSLSVNGETDPAIGHERTIGALTPRSRQAFLLRSLEGFSLEETAAIMETDISGATDLIDQAGREIAEQMATDVLIIEDEPMIALDLETIIETLGHNLLEVARTHSEAVEAAERRRPGLVLADIKLADDSSGIDAVNEILGKMEVPVIFITSYPERLLTGERPEPAFLITKPFRTEHVKAVISQALFFDNKAHTAQRMSA